jgi:hypothetical protein
MKHASAGSQDLPQAELEQLAARMAARLPQIECGDRCGPVYEFIEIGASVHHEELEWACVLHVVKQRLR